MVLLLQSAANPNNAITGHFIFPPHTAAAEATAAGWAERNSLTVAPLVCLLLRSARTITSVSHKQSKARVLMIEWNQAT